jgi:peptide deformylase
VTSNHDAFAGEFKRWRMTRGLSQTTLAPSMGYHRSYLSKIEGGQEPPSYDFAARADESLAAGGAILRAFRAIEPQQTIEARSPDVALPSSPASTLVVEHDDAALTYDAGRYQATMRRRLYNAGREPITRYLIRISVDRHPGSPERSNRLYRDHPLTWEELDLTAIHDGRDPMTWQVQQDRDAFKEVWIQFENPSGRFPLYPGEATWIEYTYYVGEDKWGQWFQRAVRLPTKRLSVRLDFPATLDASVWGIETSMTAESFPFRTAVQRTDTDNRRVFAWSTDDPPMHARYRLEWKFSHSDTVPASADTTPGIRNVMRGLGIVQDDDPNLTERPTAFDLPVEGEEARRVVAQLASAAERVSAVHTFSKGMGIAAPQIGIDRAAAIVRTPDDETITLLNPRIIDESVEHDEQYEGCLSFFDVRGQVPRALTIHVEHQDVDGSTHITSFERGLARLIAHEVDHLHGTLYRDRMRAGAAVVPVEAYRGTGESWRY